MILRYVTTHDEKEWMDSKSCGLKVNYDDISCVSPAKNTILCWSYSFSIFFVCGGCLFLLFSSQKKGVRVCVRVYNQTRIEKIDEKQANINNQPTTSDTILYDIDLYGNK